MRIMDVDLRQAPSGQAVLILLMDAPPSEFSEVASKVKEGKPYDCKIKPISRSKSSDQLAAIWAKIGEIADALYASKDEIYEECLRRYGQGIAMRIKEDAIPEVRGMFRIIDIKEKRDDGTSFVVGYKGLSEMTTAEASVLLEGVLSECREMGLSSEVKHE